MIVSEPLATLTDEERRLFDEIGPVWGSDIPKHRDLVRDVYAPRLAAVDNSAIRVHRDLAYGPHDRQVVDVFVPPNASNADVVLFVHGGAFVRGAKRPTDEIWDNVMYWFAHQGVIGVNVEYRLASDAPYPEGGRDVGRALEWTAANIGRFGGNARRLFLFGHSAGASHVVGYAFDPAIAATPHPGLAGVIAVSGRLRADVLPDNPNAKGVRAYFGDDPGQYDERSPLCHAHRSQIPVFIAVAEYENPYLDVYGAEFFHRVAAARGHAPRFVRMRKHNHTSIVNHFNTSEDLLGREVLDFMATGR